MYYISMQENIWVQFVFIQEDELKNETIARREVKQLHDQPDQGKVDFLEPLGCSE